MTDVASLRRILTENRVIAVVGLSANESRPSFFAAKYMLDHGYKIVPVNPTYEEILGQTCYPDLESIPEPVDIVDVFQRPDRVMQTTQSAIEIKAKVLWMQLGVIAVIWWSWIYWCIYRDNFCQKAACRPVLAVLLQ